MIDYYFSDALIQFLINRGNIRIDKDQFGIRVMLELTYSNGKVYQNLISLYDEYTNPKYKELMYSMIGQRLKEANDQFEINR